MKGDWSATACDAVIVRDNVVGSVVEAEAIAEETHHGGRKVTGVLSAMKAVSHESPTHADHPQKICSLFSGCTVLRRCCAAISWKPLPFAFAFAFALRRP